MGFHEVRFPVDISYGCVGGPEYLTGIRTTKGGWEQRNVNWATARRKYDISYGVKTKEQIQALLAFFNARCGKAYGFRYKDWIDYTATAQAIGTGTGISQTFQLVKVYPDAVNPITRVVKKPVAGSIAIYVNGVPLTSGWTYSTTAGTVTMTVTGAVTADFEFDVPVRFDIDYLPQSIDEFNSYSANGITLVEDRV